MTVEGKSVGERILDCRTARDMSKSKLAELTGVTAAAIWQWETRRTVPRAATLRSIADALAVDPDYLLTGKTRNSLAKVGHDGRAPKRAGIEIDGDNSIAHQIEQLKAKIGEVSGVDASQIAIEIKVSG